MKNLLIYVNPSKTFHEEAAISVKVQIDNSLDLGWKKEDLVLATNFDYEYNGVKSILVSDSNYCLHNPHSTKTNVILELFDRGLIGDDLYWVHDLDVYQLEVMDVDMGMADMALTDYGRMPRVNCGSIFFKKGARDIYGWMKEIMYRFKTDEENALMALMTNNIYWTNTPSRNIRGRMEPLNMLGTEHVGERVKKLNITYNLIAYNLTSCYAMADKPLKVAHFHILDRQDAQSKAKPSMVDFYIHGNNKLGIPLVPERLIKIFNNYGIK